MRSSAARRRHRTASASAPWGRSRASSSAGRLLPRRRFKLSSATWRASDGCTAASSRSSAAAVDFQPYLQALVKSVSVSRATNAEERARAPAAKSAKARAQKRRS